MPSSSISCTTSNRCGALWGDALLEWPLRPTPSSLGPPCNAWGKQTQRRGCQALAVPARTRLPPAPLKHVTTQLPSWLSMHQPSTGPEAQLHRWPPCAQGWAQPRAAGAHHLLLQLHLLPVQPVHGRAQVGHLPGWPARHQGHRLPCTHSLRGLGKQTHAPAMVPTMPRTSTGSATGGVWSNRKYSNTVH